MTDTMTTAEEVAAIMALVRDVEQLCDEGNVYQGTSRLYGRGEVEAAVRALADERDAYKADAERLVEALREIVRHCYEEPLSERHIVTLARHGIDGMSVDDQRRYNAATRIQSGGPDLANHAEQGGPMTDAEIAEARQRAREAVLAPGWLGHVSGAALDAYVELERACAVAAVLDYDPGTLSCSHGTRNCYRHKEAIAERDRLVAAVLGAKG